MIDYQASFTYTDGAAFPNTQAVNADPGFENGTEFVAKFIDDIWGARQALMDWANLSPDGLTEVPGTSQFISAMRKGFNIGPGFVTPYFHTSTAITGFRILPLNGQGVLVASYPDLTTAVYVGDGNNASVAAAGAPFYRADDAAGTIPNTAGAYIILPETRGLVPRGLDLAAINDPLGAGRFLGDYQEDAMQGHHHLTTVSNPSGSGLRGIQPSVSDSSFAAQEITDNSGTFQPASDGVNGTPRTSSETRMSNFSINWGITY